MYHQELLGGDSLNSPNWHLYELNVCTSVCCPPPHRKKFHYLQLRVPKLRGFACLPLCEVRRISSAILWKSLHIFSLARQKNPPSCKVFWNALILCRSASEEFDMWEANYQHVAAKHFKPVLPSGPLVRKVASIRWNIENNRMKVEQKKAEETPC